MESGLTTAGESGRDFHSYPNVRTNMELSRNLEMRKVLKRERERERENLKVRRAYDQGAGREREREKT